MRVLVPVTPHSLCCSDGSLCSLLKKTLMATCLIISTAEMDVNTRLCCACHMLSSLYSDCWLVFQVCFIAWANSIEPGEACWMVWSECPGEASMYLCFITHLTKLALLHMHSPLFAMCNLLDSLQARPSSAGRRNRALAPVIGL